MSEPELILLDEPLAGVNPTMINTLVGAHPGAQRAGYTFVILEHSMEVVMQSSRRRRDSPMAAGRDKAHVSPASRSSLCGAEEVLEPDRVAGSATSRRP
jgi:ABC-type branched-subunit amino acid transport system ATPase component